MAKPKRKISDEHRVFQQTWEEEFAFVEVNNKPLCLICQRTISVPKRENVKRHHDTCHSEFSETYPLGSNVRKDKIRSLVASFRGQQTVMRFSCKESDMVTEASFKVAWNVARSRRPFTEGELIKTCWLDASESLFADFKNKDAIIRQISKLQLSDSTLCRRVENISDDLFFKLIEDLKKTNHFSLALDESTDVSDTAQLMIWVRFFNGNSFVEELLALLPLTGQTRGEDICLTLMGFFRGPGREIDLGKLVSITTDGAPSMVGKEKGLVALLRKEPAVSDFFAYHCILHQEQLCCKLKGGELKTTMGKVVKVVNYIRSHALKHRQFRTLVEEYETQYQDLTLHAEVRWLSRGIVLEKFMDLLPVIREFITQKKQADLYYVSDEKFALDVAFLADITKHLNSLNLKLQGNNKVLPVLLNDVSAFQEKLSLYQDQLGDNDFTHFPILRSQVSQLRSSVSFQPAICVSYLDELASEFESRFTDLKVIMPVIHMVENPYNADVREVSQHCDRFGVSKERFEEELIELKNNNVLKQKHNDESMVDFWMHYVPGDSYSTITLCAKKILTCFGSTYVCESAFSTMGIIKSKQRNSLTDKHLHDCLRTATSAYQPDLRRLVAKMQTQVSH